MESMEEMGDVSPQELGNISRISIIVFNKHNKVLPITKSQHNIPWKRETIAWDNVEVKLNAKLGNFRYCILIHAESMLLSSFEN